jgi:Xaa-Pro aminopeptidase
MTRRLGFCVVALAAILAGNAPTLRATPGMPDILPLRARKPIMDGWVKLRLDRMLPEEMRRYGFDMWVVICNENVEDPVWRPLMPEDPWAARRLGMIVFYDRGAQGVERVLVAHHAKEFYTKDWKEDREGQWEALARVIRERNPKKIGIDQAVKIPYGDGLTAGLKEKLLKAIGPDLAARVQPAEELAVAMLERRLPEEMAVYPQVVAIAKAIIREGFSNEVITPEVTTEDDLNWWFNQRVVDLGMERWFFNDISIERQGKKDPNDTVIHRGDVLHCDIGIKYLGLTTDTQELAYVLREGETDVPQGLKDALKKGNRMQDILMAEFKVGRLGNEVQAAALAKGRAEGLKPRVYTHPIGLHGHGAGAFVGLPDRQDGVVEKGEYPIHPETAYSIELSAQATIPEWGGQEIRVPLEQEGYFSGTDMRFIGGRQTAFHLVR